jgi:hypothetical protein
MHKTVDSRQQSTESRQHHTTEITQPGLDAGGGGSAGDDSVKERGKESQRKIRDESSEKNETRKHLDGESLLPRARVSLDV